MKKFLLIVFTLIVTFSFNLSAQTDLSSSQANTRLRSTASNNTKEPRMPLDKWIDCYYDNGVLILSSSNQSSIREIIIIDENSIYETYYLNDSYEIIPLTMSSGVFYIRCYDSNGTEYEGYLCIP